MTSPVRSMEGEDASVEHAESVLRQSPEKQHWRSFRCSCPLGGRLGGFDDDGVGQCQSLPPQISVGCCCLLQWKDLQKMRGVNLVSIVVVAAKHSIRESFIEISNQERLIDVLPYIVES